MPIILPIEVGDTVYVGKFKNKRITVKEVGKDKHGQPTINGKNILKIRVANLDYKTSQIGESLLQKMYKTKKINTEFDYTAMDQFPKRSSAAYAASHNPGGF
jgi:hypothetical protein